MRASGLSPSPLAFSSDITTTAAAPSLRGHAFPAVTLPPSLKTGSSDAIFSSVVSARMPSSRFTEVPSGFCTGMTSRSKMPVSRARVAFIWLP